MALALNNLKRVDMPLNKETKPNLKMALKYWISVWIFSLSIYFLVDEPFANVREQ